MADATGMVVLCVQGRKSHTVTSALATKRTMLKNSVPVTP